MRYIFNITGPDHDAIASDLVNQGINPGIPWQLQPLGLCTQFYQPDRRLAEFLTIGYIVMQRFSDRNRLDITQMPDAELSWLDLVNEIKLCGNIVTSLQIPHARVNEDDPDLAVVCSALTMRLSEAPFQNDHELLRFLNQLDRCSSIQAGA